MRMSRNAWAALPARPAGRTGRRLSPARRSATAAPACIATPEARLPRIPECFSIIEHWTLTKTKFDVMAALNEADIPCGPILSMKDIYEDKELYERGYLVELDHPTRGRYVQVGMPIQLSDSPAEVKRSPLLGEHTDEVLSWLGYADGEIGKLHEDGAV